MFRSIRRRLAVRPVLAFAAFASVAVAGLGAALWHDDAAAQAKNKTITITITRVTAADFVDWGISGDADFYAKVTIAGETIATQRIRGRNDIQPNWKITKSVPAGRHDVKIAIYDRDVLKPDEFVDINRVDKKRDLDFKVDTRRRCQVTGFSGSVRCGQLIQRSGAERKRATISFIVTAE